MLLRDQIVIQVGDEVDGMVMIRSGDNRQGVCPVKFLQEVWRFKLPNFNILRVCYLTLLFRSYMNTLNLKRLGCCIFEIVSDMAADFQGDSS